MHGGWDDVCEAAVKGVGSEVDVSESAGDTGRTGGAIGAGEGAEVGDFVAVGKYLAVFRLGDIDTGNAQFSERFKFTRIGDGILVEVLPDAQITEIGILRIDDTISICILLGECVEAIGSFARYISIGIVDGGAITEKFSAVVYQPVAVAVQYEEAI